ncbi:hypothetical protein AB0383_20095 [Amycolatopsis sp. NPDC051373]|uniref:hypothetical protein n=1 Tax=Amycolatopsis sp. NPDC051373 TaxID=3155801 RepID=UPI00344D4219
MSATPLNPREAALQLARIGQEIDAQTRELVQLRDQLPALLRDARRSYAESYLSTEGSIENRKQRAVLDAENAKFRLEVHEQLIEARKDSLRSLRDRSEIGRAINSNLKEEIRTFQSGPVAA